MTARKCCNDIVLLRARYHRVMACMGSTASVPYLAFRRSKSSPGRAHRAAGRRPLIKTMHEVKA